LICGVEKHLALSRWRFVTVASAIEVLTAHVISATYAVGRRPPIYNTQLYNGDNDVTGATLREAMVEEYGDDINLNIDVEETRPTQTPQSRPRKLRKSLMHRIWWAVARTKNIVKR